MLAAADIYVLLGLVAKGDRSSSRRLASELGLSKSNIAYSLRRLTDARLLIGERKDRRLVRLAARDLLVHGVRYLFPARLDGYALGLPTAHSYPAIADQLLPGDETVIIPLPEGPQRGRVLQPIHPRAPAAAAGDPHLYEVLALVDALRVGRARERKLAAELLRQRL
jgi:DNA-binding transcriptional ArsR family regulator